MAQGDFSNFLAGLGAFESGIDPSKEQSSNYLQFLGVFDPARGNVNSASVDITNPDDLAMLQYHVHNTLGFLGKYQFGEPLLIDLGYYTPAATGYYGSTATNEWQGTWTGKNGVFSKEDFMSSVQEVALREAFAMNMNIIQQRLTEAGTSIDHFIGKTFNYSRLGEAHVATVTISGILASAHLQGPGGVANLLLNNVVSQDEYGTNILFYMDRFSDFTSPFGTKGDDLLTGTNYDEIFSGGAGVNTYVTGGGLDKIVLTKEANAHEVIQDFDVTKDVVSLQNYPNISFANLTITTLGTGSLLTLPNSQDIELRGVNPATLTANNFIQGLYSLSWKANSGDTVVQHFNLLHDIIDLNYAFASSNLRLYESNGSAVIEVVGNNQRLILEGVALA